MYFNLQWLLLCCCCVVAGRAARGHTDLNASAPAEPPGAMVPQTDHEFFGTGPNAFSIEFVTVGNPGNPVSPSASLHHPHGSVPYLYRLGKFEISREMIDKANRSAALGIPLADLTQYGGNGNDKPATGMSWNEAARFVNFLNTDRGFPPAYRFASQPGDLGYDANQGVLLWNSTDSGYNPENPYRNRLAHFFLPSADEWYKGGFYDPAKELYYQYPTGSDEIPTAVASGIDSGTAVVSQGQLQLNGPANITEAGGLSPWGTMAQGGNVSEFDESDFDLLNDGDIPEHRGIRRSYWGTTAHIVRSRVLTDSHVRDVTVGFRVASVPEPSSHVMGFMAIGWCAAVRGRPMV